MFGHKINWPAMMKAVGGRPPADWSLEETHKLVGAVNAFLKSPDPRIADKATTLLAIKSVMEKGFAAPGAQGGTPGTQKPDPYMIERYITGLLSPDLGYEKIYKLVDMRGSNLDHFTIDKAASSVSWRQVDDGEKVELAPMNDKENVLTVYYLTFKAAIGFLDDWWRYNHFWKMDDVLEQFRLTRQMKKSEIAYGLIEALGSGINQAWDTNLISTIDNACIQIVDDVEGQGYGLPENPEFDILCPPQCFRAVAFALDALGNPFAQVDSKVSRINYTINNVITSRRLKDKTKFYVILSGYQTKSGVWMDLQMESRRDIFKSAEEMVGKEQYNFGIGNAKQFKRLPISGT